MTAEHIATLYFDGSKEAAKKRLQKLKAAGFISERKRRVYEASILFITRVGLRLLDERGILTEYPSLAMPVLIKRAKLSDLTLRHELEIMDVKAAFHSAIRTTDQFSIAEFSTWPRLYEFEAMSSRNGGAEILVKPDGFIRVHEKEADGGLSEHIFFLEVDRSTETQETLVARASCYIDYYKSGGFAAKNGAARSAYKEYPFRVLMVYKTAERRNNTSEQFLKSNPPILTQVYLTTLAEMSEKPLGAIWVRPIDYRSTVHGTPFDPEQRSVQLGYQRQTAREVYVEQKIKKQLILC